MASRNNNEDWRYRVEINAAGIDGFAAHLRSSAENITDVSDDSIDMSIAAAANAVTQQTRNTLRASARTYQELADEYRLQHRI